MQIQESALGDAAKLGPVFVCGVSSRCKPGLSCHDGVWRLLKQAKAGGAAPLPAVWYAANGNGLPKAMRTGLRFPFLLRFEMRLSEE